MYFITTKRMLEVCFSAHPNIQYRTFFYNYLNSIGSTLEVSSFKMTMSSSFKIAWAIEIHFTKYFCIPIIHLSAKGTNGVMKQFQSQRPFFPVLCYPLPVGCWYTTQPEEVSGGAV